MRVAVTGAAGQIGYNLVFRIAAGDMLGPDQPVVLQMLEIAPAMKALGGVAMELEDCAFPLLAGVVKTDDPNVAFAEADVALLVGAMPRQQGMERSDLLEANGAIFTAQGRALSEAASKDVRVLVVGNPANTNCLIALNSAPGVDPRLGFRVAGLGAMPTKFAIEGCRKISPCSARGDRRTRGSATQERR